MKRKKFALIPLDELKKIADNYYYHKTGYGCRTYTPGYSEIWKLDKNFLKSVIHYEPGHEDRNHEENILEFKVVELEQCCKNCKHYYKNECPEFDEWLYRKNWCIEWSKKKQLGGEDDSKRD